MRLTANTQGGKNEGERGLPHSERELVYAESVRRKLLAHIHIAKKCLGMTDEHYRIMLEATFGVATAAALSIEQLNHVVQYFKGMGWKPLYLDFIEKDVLLGAFRRRAREIADQIPNGEKRLQGLCKSVCGAEKLEWCKDEAKLKRLLAALGNVARQEREKAGANQ